MLKTTRLFDYLVMLLAILFGGGSLILFVTSVSSHLVQLHFPEVAVLVWDTVLSLIFFLQHSGMVRRPFRHWLSGFIADRYQRAVYAIASGVALSLVAVLWQPSDVHLFTLQGPLAWIVRSLGLLAVAGFMWGVISLRSSFDMLGLAPLRSHLRGSPDGPSPFVVRGPYRWVRHPLYLCMLLLFWSNTDWTADRLLFNLLWTGWVIAGTMWEEADLVAEFGDTYRNYQYAVPMLIPWRGALKVVS